MTQALPTILVPGLLCSARLFAAQIPELWRFGAVTVVDHRQDETLDAIAARILKGAPQRFALCGLSMGGYIAQAILRAAPERVVKLALLDTAFRADTPEQTERRNKQIALAQSDKFDEVVEALLPLFIHKDRISDESLKKLVRDMAADTGPEAFVRQQRAIISRPDSSVDLPKIKCPTLIAVGDGDLLTPPKIAEEMAGLIPGSRLVIIPNCGHLSPIERPEAVTRLLVEWMQ